MVKPESAFKAEVPTEKDLNTVSAQLGREPRDISAIAHRCPCGEPDVVQTPPRLADGTPFPTLFYATCPRLTGAISTLESSGLMTQINERLQSDANLAGKYLAAHVDYEASRNAVAKQLNLDVPEIQGVTAGGMPGGDVNPLGDEALLALESWWLTKPCSELSNLVSEDK
jgi:hypothetical protein